MRRLRLFGLLFIAVLALPSCREVPTITYNLIDPEVQPIAYPTRLSVYTEMIENEPHYRFIFLISLGYVSGVEIEQFQESTSEFAHLVTLTELQTFVYLTETPFVGQPVQHRIRSFVKKDKNDIIYSNWFYSE